MSRRQFIRSGATVTAGLLLAACGGNSPAEEAAPAVAAQSQPAHTPIPPSPAPAPTNTPVPQSITAADSPANQPAPTATNTLVIAPEQTLIAGMAQAATRLFEALDAGQREKATYAFNSDERFRWHWTTPRNFPRNGLPLREMTEDQKGRALELLQASISSLGFQKALDIMSLQNDLGNDPALYYVTFFGTPGSPEPWGWRWEGHHLSRQFTVAGERVAPKRCLRLTKFRAQGETTYYHTAITPIIVRPGSSQVIGLAPTFMMPQAGPEKQDCERAAAKRWLKFHARLFEPHTVTLLGDDRYSNQPLCQLAFEHNFNFIFVCKPDSHQVLYEWLAFLAANQDIDQLQVNRWNGRFTEIALYRFINEVPLRGGDKALAVNWCEVTITHAKTGQPLYHNAFVTNHPLTEQNVVEVVKAGRVRWKSENENNNVLKTKGYHLEHNFGHGQQYLASFLLTLNLLAFLFHTVLELADDQDRLLRQILGARQTFFNVRALTRYFCFKSWQHLLNFMVQQLELQPFPDTS